MLQSARLDPTVLPRSTAPSEHPHRRHHEETESGLRPSRASSRAQSRPFRLSRLAPLRPASLTDTDHAALQALGLCMDWHLRAPPIHRYLAGAPNRSARESNWRAFIQPRPLSILGCEPQLFCEPGVELFASERALVEPDPSCVLPPPPIPDNINPPDRSAADPCTAPSLQYALSLCGLSAALT
jgi:hypothetical protein